MGTQKERRATPRKAAASTKTDTTQVERPSPPKIERRSTARTAPQREQPRDGEPRSARPAEQPSPEDIRRRIEMNAYFKAKQRGFAPGYELEDWLAAEREVKQRLQP